MDLFPSLNAAYATFFGTSPPTRACVAVDLPPPVRVKFDCFAYSETDPTKRTALHVQGLSYWAPANIGPYSQAVLVDEHMFVSGQIGLIPASLSLPLLRDYMTETALAFQHTKRVIDAVRKSSGQWKGHTQLAIYWLVEGEQAAGIAAACELSTVVCASFNPANLFSFTYRKRTRQLYFSGYLLCPRAPRWRSKLSNTPGATRPGTKRDLRSSSLGSSHSKQASDRSVTMGYTNSRLASTQVGVSSVYYEISSMESSGDACAILCVSGSCGFYRPFTFQVNVEIPQFLGKSYWVAIGSMIWEGPPHR